MLLSNLKNLIKQSPLTEKELAYSIGCTPQEMSKYVNGYRLPTEERLREIALALDVPLYMLFYDSRDDLPESDSQHRLYCPHCSRPINIFTKKRDWM